MNRKHAFVFGLLIMFGCGGGDDPSSEKVPSDLSVDVDISTDGSGKVDVTATATNAKFYTIDFGVDAAESVVSSNDGTGSFTYTESDDYTITVKAHATHSKFITATEEITVQVNEGTFIPDEGYTTPESYDGYTLVWQDEFSGESLNETDWNYETGGHGWGNNELQYYQRNNTSIVQGNLVITAKVQKVGSNNYTSSRLTTKGKQEFKYGRIDIRAALPKGQGIWPALWMLGASFPATNWPACGEIDIMEMVGGNNREKTVFGTLHWDHNGSNACTCDKPGYTLESGIFHDEFHVFTLIWDENEIKWYVDDELFNTIDTTPNGLEEFHQKYFLIFNLAVGGNWPGSPNGTTVFPQRLIVDYVRVFQKS